MAGKVTPGQKVFRESFDGRVLGALLVFVFLGWEAALVGYVGAWLFFIGFGIGLDLQKGEL